MKVEDIPVTEHLLKLSARDLELRSSRVGANDRGAGLARDG